MEKKKIIFEFIEYNSQEELPGEELELLNAAGDAAKNAYAPYSQFKVGAAVLLSNGKIFTGNNQENAAYPSGLCAERIAIFSALSHDPETSVKTIAIKTQSGQNAVAPCGSCRQVIAEYETKFNKKIKIIMSANSGKVVVVESIENLLPMMFNAANLTK